MIQIPSINKCIIKSSAEINLTMIKFWSSKAKRLSFNKKLKYLNKTCF